jgi:transcriptional regulator GlxA family with amidase domain
MTNCSQLRIGVLLVETVGLLDLAAIDVFNICSAPYLQSRNFPSSVTSLAPSVSFLYISQSNDNHSLEKSFAKCTADGAFRITHSLSSEDCEPGKLDILVIPGPQPWVQISPEVKAFVQGHAAVATTTILSICTGAFVVAQSGILDGRVATGTKAHLPKLEQTYRNVEWVAKRWVSDGNVWTSGIILFAFIIAKTD